MHQSSWNTSQRWTAAAASCRWPLGAGQLRIAAAADGTSRRVVLLIGQPRLVTAELRVVEALLCSDEVDLAADTDTVVGGSFELLVHGDLVAPIPVDRLGKCVGALSRAVRRDVVLTGLRRHATLGSGPPVRDRGDIRWQFKLDELARLRELAGRLDWLA